MIKDIPNSTIEMLCDNCNLIKIYSYKNIEEKAKILNDIRLQYAVWDDKHFCSTCINKAFPKLFETINKLQVITKCCNKCQRCYMYSYNDEATKENTINAINKNFMLINKKYICFKCIKEILEDYIK